MSLNSATSSAEARSKGVALSVSSGLLVELLMYTSCYENLGHQLAAQIAERFKSPELQALLTETRSAADDVTGTFEVVITTENVDRYQEVTKLDGWDLEHYRKNPVVLWGHDHNQPIGMATSVAESGGVLRPLSG